MARATQFRRHKRKEPGNSRRATALVGPCHASASEEPASPVALPRTPRPAIVWCGDAETHPFSGHSAIDASDTSASRAEGPRRPASPKDSIKGEPRDPQQARGVAEDRAVRTRARAQARIRHGLSWFECILCICVCCLLSNFDPILIVWASHFRAAVKNPFKTPTWGPA